MPRKARIDFPGLTHHVMARTFIGTELFRDDEDRAFFVSLMSKRIPQSGCACYAWALMSNHYHFLIRTSEKPLWQLMKPLNTDYAHYYNKKHDRRGALFSDRYKSIATQDQNYLERLVRYIHRNPLRGGICKSVADLNSYSWTGHSALMGAAGNSFQDIQTVLRRFGKNTSAARKNYFSFINQSDDDVTVENNVRASNAGKRDRGNPDWWIIGDPEFQKEVLKKDRANRLTLARYKKENLTVEAILKRAAHEFRVPEDLVRRPSKRTVYADARMAFCHWARQCGIPSREIGALLGIQQAAVSHAARKGEGVVIARNLTRSIV